MLLAFRRGHFTIKIVYLPYFPLYRPDMEVVMLDFKEMLCAAGRASSALAVFKAHLPDMTAAASYFNTDNAAAA